MVATWHGSPYQGWATAFLITSLQALGQRCHAVPERDPLKRWSEGESTQLPCSHHGISNTSTKSQASQEPRSRVCAVCYALQDLYKPQGRLRKGVTKDDRRESGEAPTWQHLEEEDMDGGQSPPFHASGRYGRLTTQKASEPGEGPVKVMLSRFMWDKVVR